MLTHVEKFNIKISNKHNWPHAVTWCRKQYRYEINGPQRIGTWEVNGLIFTFEKEQDAVMFALRWA